MKILKFAMTAAAVTLMTAAAPVMVPVAAHAPAGDKDPVVPIAIPAPPPGKGQIVFFRSGGGGFAVGCSVNEHGQKVSSLGAGRYFIMVLDPGRHEFTVKSEAKDVLALEVEADETQFATCKIKMGILIGRPDIRPSTEAEFRKAKNLKLVDEDDMGPPELGALRQAQITAALGAQAPATAAAPAQ
ncbi:DUF2846 domain-containing protein [Sphingomonas sp. LB-2]|uniref:DUF2846 domain-containing protein n=1 Tax=Sphingomonas caeni TaxID=2984949 RepID=UPI00223295C3|nr:DUF2846 domain-containing protein [Sphingomonas caeni]MCW3845780.1 DUF2846 domain-containing protein [Sphingomonas caeni]